MKYKFILWILLVFIGAFVLYTAESVFLQHSISEKTLRLHVVANSDSPEDQRQKLRLRDHILHEVELLTEKCRTLTDTELTLIPYLNDLQASAQEFLRNEGSDYDVSISLCQEKFTTRDYESFRLPAGSYHSLRVKIGNAKGQNWWCVVFPSLCTAATEGALQSCAEIGGYNEDECQFIQKTEPKFELRFKLLEWFNWLTCNN